MISPVPGFGYPRIFAAQRLTNVHRLVREARPPLFTFWFRCSISSKVLKDS